ncbi:MAG: mannose-1-phosphate guanylyltransferase [Candidatus Acidiferrales bacterium]
MKTPKLGDGKQSPSLTEKRGVSSLDHIYAVILAGGSGTRFWPLSRRRRPKQLLNLFGERSLLAQTVARVRALIPPERTYIFTNERIQAEVVRELPEVPRHQVIAEPASRNTAPTIGLAAYEVLRRDPDGLMVVLPSDHLIAKEGLFRRALQAGCDWAAAQGCSVLIGIKPTHPETGYGYVRLGRARARARGFDVFDVRQFTEKPGAAMARRYVRSGNYLWNAGMFIWKASTLVENLQRFQPQMSAGLQRLNQAGGIRSSSAFKRIFPQLENISIDYALMEKIPDVYAMAADIGWSDVGSWAAAYELSAKDKQGNVQPAASFLLDSRRNMIVSDRKFVAAIGVDDLVVVETEDAILVCRRDRAQDAGKVVRELERRKMERLL